MGVDTIDLIQLHSLVEEDDWQTAFRDGGAVATLFAARDEGLVRHVGVTGHGLRIPKMHFRPGRGPICVGAVPVVARHDRATRVRGRRRSPHDALPCGRHRVADDQVGRPLPLGRHRSPFQLVRAVGAGRRPAPSVEFVLADPRLFLNTTSDARLLPAIIEAAQRFDGRAPDAALLAQDRDEHGITPLFDGDLLERI